MKLRNIGILFITTTSVVIAREVYDIKDCPALEPRYTFAEDATDVHVNDIKVIAGIGDSMMAGFLMDGYEKFFASIFSIVSQGLIEYRGESYTMGGDKDAITIPNFLKTYNPELIGYSVGKRKGYLCTGYCPELKYYPETDVLNAALTGAMSINLDKELDYLLEAIYDPRYSIQLTDGWKLVNLQIGYNDLCKYCDRKFKQYSIPEVFEQNIERAILRIRDAIPKVIVNIFEILDISSLAQLTKGQSYCFSRFFPDYRKKCPCLASQIGRDLASYVAVEYNNIFIKLAAKYAATPGSQFAVMYTPLNFNISSFKVEAFSLDCFHLSTTGQALHAKVGWKNMFSKNRQHLTLENYDEDKQIYCAEDDDRLATRMSDLLMIHGG